MAFRMKNVAELYRIALIKAVKVDPERAGDIVVILVHQPIPSVAEDV